MTFRVRFVATAIVTIAAIAVVGIVLSTGRPWEIEAVGWAVLFGTLFVAVLATAVLFRCPKCGRHLGALRPSVRCTGCGASWP